MCIFRCFSAQHSCNQGVVEGKCSLGYQHLCLLTTTTLAVKRWYELLKGLRQLHNQTICIILCIASPWLSKTRWCISVGFILKQVYVTDIPNECAQFLTTVFYYNSLTSALLYFYLYISFPYISNKQMTYPKKCIHYKKVFSLCKLFYE